MNIKQRLDCAIYRTRLIERELCDIRTLVMENQIKAQKQQARKCTIETLCETAFKIEENSLKRKCISPEQYLDQLEKLYPENKMIVSYINGHIEK